MRGVSALFPSEVGVVPCVFLRHFILHFSLCVRVASSRYETRFQRSRCTVSTLKCDGGAGEICQQYKDASEAAFIETERLLSKYER
jgi:hypothetical protein